MENVKTGKEKQANYACEYKRLERAMKEEFYLEAVSIEYAIIEDRFIAFLHYAGVVSRQKDSLSINSAVLPFIRILLDKKNNEPIRVKDVSIKMEIIRKLLQLTGERAVEIDNEVIRVAENKRKLYLGQKGYMAALQKQIAITMDTFAALNVLGKLEPWRNERNQLIHALLNKTMKSSEEARKDCAEKGKKLGREVDDVLVKAFKKNNRIRKQFNIQ